MQYYLHAPNITIHIFCNLHYWQSALLAINITFLRLLGNTPNATLESSHFSQLAILLSSWLGLSNLFGHWTSKDVMQINL